MEDSILLSVKKYLGISADYDVFDQDILMSINGAMMTLQQIGIGPSTGYTVLSNEETWSDFMSSQPNVFLQGVRAFVYIKTRLLFDPPATSFGITALESQLREYEWRLNVQVDPRPIQVQGVYNATG